MSTRQLPQRTSPRKNGLSHTDALGPPPFERPERPASEAEALLGVVAALARGGTLDEQLERAMAVLPGALGARRVVLVLTGDDIIIGAGSPGYSGTAGPLVIEATEVASRRLPPEAVDRSSLLAEKDGAVTAAPVKADGRVVGMLTVAGSDAPLEGSRFRLLGGVLDAVGARWEQARAAGVVAEESADAEIMRSAVQAATGSGDIMDKLRRITGVALSALDGEGIVAIGRAEEGEAGFRWITAATRHGESKDVLGYSDALGSLVGLALAERTPMAVNDIVGPGREALGSFAGRGRSALALPLIETAGAMLVVSSIPNAFPQRRIRLLSGLAAMAGLLLKNDGLQREIEEGQRREQQRLEAFHVAASRLTLEEDPETALREFVDSARNLVGAKYGGVVVWDVDGSARTLVSRGLPDADIAAGIRQLHIEELLALVRYALVQERKKAIRVGGSSLVPNKADPEVPLLRSLLGVPFMTKEGSPGAFFLVDKEAQPRFSTDDERLLRLFSSMASILLDNMQLYEALDRQHRTLSGIQNSMNEGLVVLDRQGRVILSNPAADRLVGTDLSHLEGMALSLALQQGEGCFEDPVPVRNLVAFLEGPGTEPADFKLTLVRPKRCDVTVSVFPIEISETERLTGLLLRDVTDERDLQRRRDTFVSVASHELRTPMTTIVGFTELLLKREVPPAQRAAWLQHVYDDSQRVISIVDDLLNVSRIQSGHMNVSLVEAETAELVREAVDALAASSDIHQMVVDVPPDLPPVVADSGKVVQVLVNLISNAIKYSPAGGTVAVSARAERRERRVVLAVRDEGIGIAEEHLANLFTTFQRIDREETRYVRGTGLGLYIVKSLVELMGGAVWVESRLHEGSTFFFSLPTAGR